MKCPLSQYLRHPEITHLNSISCLPNVIVKDIETVDDDEGVNEEAPKFMKEFIDDIYVQLSDLYVSKNL
jgi:hypothetical protein